MGLAPQDYHLCYGYVLICVGHGIAMAQKESELEEIEKLISKAITMYKKVIDDEIKQLIRECVLRGLTPPTLGDLISYQVSLHL